jgi:hypothetical protein
VVALVLDEDMTDSYRCSTCGQVHVGLPLSFAAEFPDQYAKMTREERDARAVIGSDQCIIDQQWFFIRGCLEIPIVDSDEVFLWGLWASVRQEVFDEISECWELAGRERSRGPFKGRLVNSLAEYPETFNLKMRIVLQPVGARPLFVVEEADHPLAIEQSSGITRERALAMSALVLHQERGGFPEAFKG